MARAGPSLQQGASIVEITVALAVLASLLGLGAPALVEMQQSRVLSAATWDLLADLNLARAEALKRNHRVTLCKSADGRKCVAEGGWEQGWIVFHDDNGNGTADGDEPRIAHHAALDPGLRFSGNQPVSSYVSYTPVGATRLKGGGFQAGTLTLCRRSGSPTQARQVIVNALGRPRVQVATVASCV